jgi:pilus assembly protein CpaF
MEANTIVMHDIFVFDQKGINREGRVIGEYKATGVRPLFAEKFRLYGVDLPPGIFED